MRPAAPRREPISLRCDETKEAPEAVDTRQGIAPAPGQQVITKDDVRVRKWVRPRCSCDGYPSSIADDLAIQHGAVGGRHKRLCFMSLKVVGLVDISVDTWGTKAFFLNFYMFSKMQLMVSFHKTRQGLWTPHNFQPVNQRLHRCHR